MKNLFESYLNFNVKYRTLIFYKPTKHQLPLPFKVVFLLQFVQRFNFKNCKVTPICTSSLTISLPNFMFSSFIPELNKRFDRFQKQPILREDGPEYRVNNSMFSHYTTKSAEALSWSLGLPLHTRAPCSFYWPSPLFVQTEFVANQLILNFHNH